MTHGNDPNFDFGAIYIYRSASGHCSNRQKLSLDFEEYLVEIGLGAVLRERSFFHGTNGIINNDANVSKKKRKLNKNWNDLLKTNVERAVIG